MNKKIELVADIKPQADQINAIKKLTENINNGINNQVLLGATGTGKTFTIANVIKNIQKKTLIIVHNKTLAGQLYTEFKKFFPNNKVEYFISYFDFFQPEAYKPITNVYIEKSAVVNKEIEMLRLSTINSLANYNDVIVIASVAAIYSSISPNEYQKYQIFLKVGEEYKMKTLQYDLVRMQYQRNDTTIECGTFSIKGDSIIVNLGYTDEYKVRISFGFDKIESITLLDRLNNNVIKKVNMFSLGSATEYLFDGDSLESAITNIRNELDERISYFEKNNMLVEAQRIKERTNHDLEKICELGYCNGIENYSAQLEHRKPNQTPYTIFDFFKDDYLLVIDESHMTIPQIVGMYNTDRSRKETLVKYGWRLPSALDNRPLKFNEFENKINNAIYVSATPCEWEINKSKNNIVEQIVRPTGLLDPTFEIKPTTNQIDTLLEYLAIQKKNNEKTFITVLTIKMAEELTKFLIDKGHKIAYLHNELKTLERTKVINDLRKGRYEAIIGINLLREGLDVPEVSLVVIFDADKQGLFRNERSLIQIFGRAARNQNGRILMFADSISSAMKKAMEETNRRRNIQIKYNKKNKIVPKTITKPIFEIGTASEQKQLEALFLNKKSVKNKEKLIEKLKQDMYKAAENKEYEAAADLRDMIVQLEEK